MSTVMPNMGWVNQGEQHIDIEEKSHGSSSRSALTISSVTMTPGLPLVISGLRLDSGVADRQGPASAEPDVNFKGRSRCRSSGKIKIDSIFVVGW
jgi:hypothetical protein